MDLINLPNDNVGQYMITFTDALSFGAITIVTATIEALMARVS